VEFTLTNSWLEKGGGTKEGSKNEVDRERTPMWEK
jgi:hypothetical protein